jgi:hypothetical protein
MDKELEAILLKLMSSRRYDGLDFVIKATPVVELITDIYTLAKRKGYRLHRWQANYGPCGSQCTVTYGVTAWDTPRPARSTNRVVVALRRFDHPEGQTSRCPAFGALLHFQKIVELLPSRV